MKKIIAKHALSLFFIVVLISPVLSQNNFYFQSANMNILVPSGWVTSEHLLLLMMPKNQDLQLKFELVTEINKDEAVLNTLNELKAIYPQDTNFIIKDYVINKFKIREIINTTDADKINYFIVETPEQKIVKIYFTASKEIALKYNNEIQKIIKSFKIKG